MNNRVTWVDYAKAIGIILVVYGHVARGLQKSGIELPTYLFELVDSVIYSFHMPLFFFLSGLFFCESFSKIGGRQLALRKIDSILYPYVLWSLFQGCAEVAMSSHTNGTTSIGDVLAFPWAPRAQFWFLYALFIIFAVSSIIYSLTPRRAAILVFPFAICLYLVSSNIYDYWVIKSLLDNFVFFIFGIIFTAHLKAEHLSSASGFVTTFCGFIFAQWIFHGPLSLEYTDRGIYSLVLACISILFTVSLSMQLARRSYGFLAYIGASSMVIYLMHIMAGSGARILLSKLFAVNSSVAHLIAGCIFGIFLPLLLFKVIGRLKIPFLFSAPVSVWLESLFKRTMFLVGR